MATYATDYLPSRRDMTIREFQTSLPWTIHYHRDFRQSPMSHKDFGHALIHVMKAAGKLAGLVNDAEHGGCVFSPEDTDPYVADMVVCALRMANTCPGRIIDLQRAVHERIEGKNGVQLDPPEKPPVYAYLVGILEVKEDGSVALARVGIQSAAYDQTAVKVKTEIPVELGCFPGPSYELARTYTEDWVKHLADMGHPFFAKIRTLMGLDKQDEPEQDEGSEVNTWQR